MITLLNKIKHATLAKQLWLSFALGAVSSLAMPPVFAWPLLFFTFPPIIWMLDEHIKRSRRFGRTSHFNWRAGLIGWSFGFGYFFVSLYWIGASFLVEAEKFAFLLPFAVTLLPLLLGAFWGLAFIFTGLFWPNSPVRFVIFSLLLGFAEILRGHLFTGFPWHLIGLSLTGDTAMMQSLTLFGSYGLTLIAILLFVSPSDVYRGSLRASKPDLISPLAAALILLGLIGFGQLRLYQSGAVQYVPDLTLHIIQPNIPQKEKVDPKLRVKAFEKTLALTKSLDLKAKSKMGENHHHLIIWPETAIPFALAKAPQILEILDDMLPKGSSLITGAYAIGPKQKNKPPQIYNSLFLVNDSGNINAVYHKNHLVPFGEYLPYTETLNQIGLEALVRMRGGFAKGLKRESLSSSAVPAFTPYICYEAIFPAKRAIDAKWQLNISNDAWFGNTAGPYQHLHHIRVRSVETGLPMVRAVNGGISALYDGLGRQIAITKLNQKTHFSVPLPNSSILPIRENMRYILVIVIYCTFLIFHFLPINFDRIM